MSAQWLVLLAIFLPFVGAGGIALCGRWPNLRETVTLVTAGTISIIVISLFLRMQQGETVAFQLGEPLPGLPIFFEIEPLGV